MHFEIYGGLHKIMSAFFVFLKLFNKSLSINLTLTLNFLAFFFATLNASFDISLK